MAQSTVVQSTIGVTVGLSQAGPIFYVDGQQYSSAQVFLWPTGSTHILQFPYSIVLGQAVEYQSSNDDQARWTFGGWVDNLGLLAGVGSSNVVTVTVVPGLTSVIGSVTELFELSIIFPSGTGSGGTNPGCTMPPFSPSPGFGGWGLVYIDNVCYSDTTSVYVAAGSLSLSEFAFPGYGFVGFQVGGSPPNRTLTTYNLTQPGEAITVYFAPAKLVSFRTSPLGLQVTVDDVTIDTPPTAPTVSLPTSNINPGCTPYWASLPVGTPAGVMPLCIGDFDFLPGSTHQIGAPPTQQDATGAWWVFSSFNDGIGQNGAYVTNANTSLPDAVIADFVPGMQSAILTNPAGLKISIDGSSVWQNYNFVWAQGSTHTLVAPATQVDSSGRTWQFVSWSNGGSASQTITVPTSSTTGAGFSVTANYTLLGQTQITSIPTGLTFTVGGASCTTPCTLNQPSGTQIQVTIPASIAESAGSELNFVSWSGGSTSTATTLQVTQTQAAVVYTANYQTYYLLTASSSPANEATFKTSPVSLTGFFPSGTQITVTPVPNAGYKFTGWGGDLSSSGALIPGALTMGAPHSVVAFLQAVPSIAPAGIINAAGPTPDGTVAAGSIISIYGQNLAAGLQVGPADPLAQTIGNVTVTVSNILMPLMFVSPGQINAQVPTELTPGTYTLTVQSLGQPPVSGSFTVSRDAPGIFVEPNAENIPLAAALHQDGSVISLSSPAVANEIVSLYGTGFGPLSQLVGDGFAAPMSPLITLADAASVDAGSVTQPAVWAGAAPGLVGIDIVQFKMASSIPSATNMNIVVTVGGKPSATVQLPVQ